MLLSKDEKESSLKWVKAFDKLSDLSPMMIKSTVKLTAPQFTASGVIFNVTDNAVEILTAAHNLLVWKGLKLPPNDWTQLSKDFAAKLIVHYAPQDSKFNGPTTKHSEEGDVEYFAVADVKNGCGNEKDCYYDVAVIKCVNAELCTFAKELLGESYSLKAMATSASSRAPKFLDVNVYVLLQLGYGKISDSRFPQTVVKNNSNKDVIEKGKAVIANSGPPANEMANYNLQYRMTRPLTAQYVCVYDQIGADTKPPAYCGNCDAIQLKGSIISSSAEGDSGGPVFAIQYTKLVTKDPQHPDDRTKDKTQFFFHETNLIGVTTGSDMKLGKQAPGNPYFNDIATSVIPYLETRKA